MPNRESQETDFIRKTKIVCTIGPACDSEEMMKELDILYGSRVNEEEIDRKISDLRKKIEILEQQKRQREVEKS